jgi:hypothetical protein
MENSLDAHILYENISEVYKNRDTYIGNMDSKSVPDGTVEIMKLIKKFGNLKH